METPNSASWYAPNNQIIGWGYDKGNLTRVGNLYTLGYDAENRQKTAAIGGLTATYQYDGDGRRVQKTVTMGGGSPVTTFVVYDASGELAAEYGLGTETGLHYVTQDALGSPRLRTNADGTVAQNYDYLPFGQEIGAGTANRDNTFSPGIYPAASSIGGSDVRFTGKERDAESGLDYFGARYFSSAQGRFMSPDEFKGGFLDAETGQAAFQPGPLPYADIADPQTLNKYAYVRNNPLRYTDPDGHCSIAIVDCGPEIAAGATAAGTAIGAAGAGAIAALAGLAAGVFTYDGSSSLNGARGFGIAGEGGATRIMMQQDAKAVPNPNGSKGAPDHQQTADEEAAKMGPNGQREVRVVTTGGAKGSRVIDAAKVENGKVTEATQVIRPNKNGTPPAREVRAAKDIEQATGVKPELVRVRPRKPDGSQ